MKRLITSQRNLSWYANTKQEIALPNELTINTLFAVNFFMMGETNSDANPVPIYEIPARNAICPFVISRSFSISSCAVGMTPVSRFRNNVLAQNKVNRVRQAYSVLAQPPPVKYVHSERLKYYEAICKHSWIQRSVPAHFIGDCDSLWSTLQEIRLPTEANLGPDITQCRRGSQGESARPQDARRTIGDARFRPPSPMGTCRTARQRAVVT